MIEDNFIGVFENVFTPEFCNEAIAYFESMKASGFVKTRRELDGINKNFKDDESLFLHQPEVISLLGTGLMNFRIHEILSSCHQQYIEKFNILETFARHGSAAARLQKTAIGGGYHLWHCESDRLDVSNRVLAWMAYLNDVEEGGETEFLYQHKRVKPKTGTLLMWPAGFTHPHRGNPPLSNEKYVLTGWLEF